MVSDADAADVSYIDQRWLLPAQSMMKNYLHLRTGLDFGWMFHLLALSDRCASGLCLYPVGNEARLYS